MAFKNEPEAIVEAKTFSIMADFFPAALRGTAGACYSTNDPKCRSIYSKANALAEVSLNRVITKALYRGVQATLFPDVYTGFGACDNGKTYVGEYQLVKDFTDPRTDAQKQAVADAKFALCVYSAEEGTFMSGEAASKDSRNFTQIKNRKDEDLKDTTYMVYAMLPFLLKDSELERCFETLCENYVESLDDPSGEAATAFREAMYVANDNILCRLRLTEPGKSMPAVPVRDNATMPINNVHFMAGTFTSSEPHGTLLFFNGSGTTAKRTAAIKGKTINQLRGIYAIPGVTYTEEEQKMIPVMPDNTVISEEAMEIAKMVRDSTSLRHPKRNFCLFGPSGLGKTTITQQVAVMLGMPYIIQGCNADTDASDLVVQAVPNESVVSKIPEKIPGAMDIAMNPAKAYRDITGTEKADATEKDCLLALAAALNPSNGNAAKVRYEKANIIKGITKPYLVEVQEPSTMQKQGALTVLNSLMDDCRQITLPSGETIYRDPNSVIMMTTNMGYEGTRDLNQSVLSRCRKLFIQYPKKETEIVNFLLKATDLKDKNVLKTMAKVFLKVRDICEDNGINQGSYGYRELIDWCDEAEMTKMGDSYDLINSCKKTLLLSAAVHNEDDFIELTEAANAFIKQ